MLQDVGSKVMIATAGTEVKNVEWTGAAGDGDATNPANWKESATGAAVNSLVNAIATVSGNNLRINLPAGSDPGFLGMTIGVCSLAADCDLGGQTLVHSSLALNGGELQNGTLTIDGFLEIPLDGNIVNRGELDLSDATIRLAEPENVRSGVVVKCSDGGVITGVPKRGNLPKGWRVRIVNGNLALTSGGTHIILR